MEFKHISVLLDEVIESLNIKPDGIYVDGTVGGAGHSSEIAKRLTTGRLIALDRDPDAVKIATERLKNYNATVIQSNFADMKQALASVNIHSADGILLDLGVSSYQLDCGERGFSYKYDAPLDMRMSKSGTTAAYFVNNLSAEELAKIFRDYGEERFAYKIACSIVKQREKEKIETTGRLAEIIASCYPAAARREGNPARKCFQAIRIAVNDEFGSLERALDTAFDLLNTGGVLSIITFHSLEDRIVKQRFKQYTIGCTCPPDFPICVCGKKPRGQLRFKKPITASNEELNLNSRSRSAKLRSIVKL